MKTIEQKGMYQKFPRSGKDTRVTHYCAGCGHGIVNKLVAECCAEMGLQDSTIFVDPVGCGVFTYYYWDAAHISAAHGRASAAATGVSRARPDAVTVAYQGDGDLGAIGFNNAFQAASRGEKFGCIFINNSLYGMTGGQMHHAGGRDHHHHAVRARPGAHGPPAPRVRGVQPAPGARVRRARLGGGHKAHHAVQAGDQAPVRDPARP